LTALLEISGLDVYYGDFQALFGVGLRVAQGQALALVGANGAGKTTLLRTIAGAISPARGTIRYDGEDITTAAAHRRIRRGIALVPEGRRLFPSLTVEENILVGAAAAASAAWPLERIYEIFPLIARRRRHRASQLSAVSSRRWPSAGRWPPRRACCCSMRSRSGWRPRWWASSTGR